jgi:hypothetical protein
MKYLLEDKKNQELNSVVADNIVSFLISDELRNKSDVDN